MDIDLQGVPCKLYRVWVWVCSAIMTYLKHTHMETNAEIFNQVKITSEKHSGQTCLTVFTVENVLLLVRHLQK